MAEKIGFISFSAFELQKANEFDGIKRKAYDTAHPTRSFFETYPPIPDWNRLARAGVEPIERKTPDEFLPLMNEYHRYFMENSLQNEAYLRWVRRHRAWDRETEVVFGRFSQLRDHLNDRFARDDYARRGRMHQIMDQATQKAWLHTEALLIASENEVIERRMHSAKALQKKLAAQAFFQQRTLGIESDREAWKSRDEATRIAPTTQENRIPLNVNAEQSWSQGLAIAHYQQQIQRMPIMALTPSTHTTVAAQTPLAVPIVKKVNGMG